MYKFFKIIFVTFLFCLSGYSYGFSDNEKIKIGLLIPMSGENKELGQLIIKSTRMALSDIGNNKIEIYPKDTGSDPSKTLQSANELKTLVSRFL